MKKIYNTTMHILSLLHLSLIIRLINDLRHYYWYFIFHNIFKESRESIDSTIINNSKVIWIFWWQGIDSMPPIVKACYDSALRHSNGYKVVLITEKNFKEYTDIDANALDALQKNKISLTAFSDVLRFNLLKNNGGIWIDATVYVTEDFKEEYFGKMFTVGIDDRKYHYSVNGSYSGFLFGGCNNGVIDFMDSFYRSYFRRYDHIKYYFTIDEALNYCYRNNIDSFKNYVDNNSFNSDNKLHEMAKVLNDEFSTETFNKVNNRFSKLTYKMNFDLTRDTFYRRLINKEYPFEK